MGVSKLNGILTKIANKLNMAYLDKMRAKSHTSDLSFMTYICCHFLYKILYYNESYDNL